MPTALYIKCRTNMIEIVIGDCADCIHLEPNQVAYLCRKTGIIYLGKWANNRLIERAINHEVLHAVLMKTIGKETSSQFDNMFKHGGRSVGSDGAPNV